MLVINSKLFNGVPAKDQEILKKSALEAMDYEWHYVKSKAGEALKAITDAGLKVTYLNDEQKDAFKKKLAAFNDKWEQKIGKRLLDQLKEEVKKNSGKK